MLGLRENSLCAHDLHPILIDVCECLLLVEICVCCVSDGISVHVSPAVHSDGMVARLLLLLLHCSNYVDHAFPICRDPHFWPTVEMELTHRSSLVLLDRGNLWVFRSVLVTETDNPLQESKQARRACA